MARKAAWEDLADADLGPYAKSRGTRWGRVFTGLLLIAIATFVVAYYFPLFRAHQKLAQQYRDLDTRAQGLSDTVSNTQVELKAAALQRDHLQSEHDRLESANKKDDDRLERVRGALTTKLDKLVKKGAAAVVVSGGSLVVVLDSAFLFQPRKLELTPAGRTLLCDVVKSTDAKSVTVRDSLTEGAAIAPALAAAYAGPWALSAARSAAVAQGVQDRCAFPGAQLSATGYGTRNPISAQLGSFKAASDHVELELGLH